MSELMAEARSTEPTGNFLSRLLDVFVSPKKVFSDIDAGARWWEPWIWVSVLNMIVAYIVIPVQVQLYRLRADQMPKEQFDQTIEKMQSFPIAYLGIIAAPVTVLLVGMIFAAVSYIAVSVLSERASFKKHLTLYLWASMIPTLGMLLSNIIVRVKGVEKIRSMTDAMVSLGPGALVPEGHKILTAVLSTVDVFGLWFYALIAMGVVYLFRLSGRSAILVVLPIWLLSVLMALIGTRIGGTP